MSNKSIQIKERKTEKQEQTSREDRLPWKPPQLILLESESTQSGKNYLSSEKIPYCGSPVSMSIPPAMIVGSMTCTSGSNTGTFYTSGPS